MDVRFLIGEHIDETPKMRASFPQIRGPLAVVGWDGVLPLVAAGIPLFVRATLPQNQTAQTIVVLFLPILTALVRTSVGWNQIARIGNGRAPWHRQTALAVAIVLLLLFEACSAALIFTDNAPIAALLIPLLLYCSYLLLIWLALWTSRTSTFQARSTTYVRCWMVTAGIWCIGSCGKA